MLHFRKRELDFNVMTARDGVINYTYDIYEGHNVICRAVSHSMAIKLTSNNQ